MNVKREEEAEEELRMLAMLKEEKLERVQVEEAS